MGRPPTGPGCRGLRMALEIETQGGFIFREKTGARLNQGLTGANSASGFHCKCFDPVLLFSIGQSLEMCP